jgi:Zn-dependent protease with chaperone function
MERKALIELNSKEYEHPFDQKALKALEGTPGLETLVKKFYEFGIEKILRIQFTGSYLKVTKNSFPELDKLLQQACDILSLPERPRIYIKKNEALGSFVTGVHKPLIILDSGVLNELSDEEILFLIGRQIGHIKSQHVLYHEIGLVLPFLADIFGTLTLGLSNLLSAGLKLTLLHWIRMSEYTADRAGLLACQDVEVASTTLIKLAGLPSKYFDTVNIEDFIEQAKEFEGYDQQISGKMIKAASIIFQDQPWTIMRAAEFYKWLDSGQYEKVLSRETQIRHSLPPPSEINFCPGCGYKRAGDELFCPKCGNKFD